MNLIPEENLLKVLSPDKANEIVATLDSIKNKTNSQWESMDSYLTFLGKEGKGYIADYVKANQNQIYVTEDVIKASENARNAQLAQNKAIKATTISARAGQVALKGFSLALNAIAYIGITTVISSVINLISEMINSTKDLQKAVEEWGIELTETVSSINDYKTKIQELQTVMNDNSSSYEEVSQARIDLMAIQDELIEKFGTEKETIEIITTAINEQSEALDELSKKTYYEAKNNFKDKSAGQAFIDYLESDNISNALYHLSDLDFSEAWKSLTKPTEDQFSKMIYNMENSYYEFERTGNEVLDDLLIKTYNLGTSLNGGFSIHGNLDEVYNTLLEIQQLSKDYEVSDKFDSSLTKIANSANTTYKAYKDFYDQYILFEKILNTDTSNTYDDKFAAINEVKEKYDEALLSGNEDKIKETAENYCKTLTDSMDEAIANDDKDVAHYFENMYPELQEIVGKWKFEIKFKASLEDSEDTFSTELKNAAKTFGTSENLKNYNHAFATKEEQDAYAIISNAVEEVGLSFNQFINKMVEDNIISSQAKEDLLDKLLPSRTDLSAGFESAFDEAMEGIDTNTATAWVNTLNEEELKIANSSEFDKALAKQRANLDNATLGAENYTKALKEAEKIINATESSKPLSKSGMIDQINTLSDGFDILDEIYADVKDGDVLNLSSDKFDEAFHNLKEEYTEFIETVSSSPNDVKACQTAFNNLTTAYLKQSGVLDNVNDQNAQVAVAMLQNMGVANSESIVFSILAEKSEELAFEKQFLADTGIEASEATEREIADYILAQEVTDNCSAAYARMALNKILANSNTIDTSADVNNVLRLAKAANVGAEALAKFAKFQADLEEAEKSGDSKRRRWIIESINEYSKQIQSEIDNAYNADYTGANTSNKSSSSSSEKDEHLEEYKTKLSILQDELDQELINERQFYDKSESLLNQYLKDSPEHIKKYEEEISDAEKTLHSDWVNAYQAQHDELDEALNKNTINAVQYCQQLAKLGQEYYGIFDSISSEESIKLLPEQLQKSVKSYQEATVSAQTYANSLEEIYKQYGNINNVDRNILYWDEENLSKYANAISTWNWDVNLGDYSSVEGFSENIDGLEIAMTPMFDNGTELIPLTQDEFNNYLTQVINAAYENGGFNADNLLAFDAQGFDVEINGVLTHVSNMIAGVEGQIVNGTQLTANDIKAIAGATSEEIGYALNSIYDGYGMHEVQQNILGVKAEYEKLAAEAKACGYNIDEYIGRKGSASVQRYGKYVKEAKEAVQELSEKIKSTFDDAINGVISILDSQISDLQDACDSITDSYKEQQKAIDKQIKSYEKQKDSLEDQKDAIQDQLDAIEEATEQKRQQLDLEEKLYTVNRKSNQKTQMTIGENGHLTYDIDKSGLASAREDLQEAQQEIEKANLEKQIKALEDQIDSIDDIIDKLNDQKEEFDDLIEATENYYDNIIKGLENYQKQWQKLIDESEKQEALKLAESLGITEGEILGMSQEAFANINDKYKLLLKCIYSGNDDIVEQFAILNGLGTDEFVNAVGNADQALADFREDAEKNLKDTLDTTTTVLGVDTSEEETKKNATTTGNSDTSNMVGAFSTSEDLILTGFNTFTGEMETKINALEQKATSMAEKIVKACEDAKRALESMSNFTSSNLNLPNSYNFAGTGASFADGTGRLMSTEKNAMVSEIAPELVVDTEHGVVQLFDKPTMLDLPKGAIVYNGEQTKRILDNKQSLVGDSKAHSNGTAKRTGMSIEELNAKGEILRKMLSEQDYVPIFDKTKMNYNATNPSVINNVTTINNNTSVTSNFGNIYLEGVQNPNDFAEQIVKRMPNLMIQKLNKRL